MTIRLLEHGSILNTGDQYVRLVGDRLIVTRQWPGATSAPKHCSQPMLTPLEQELAAEFAEAEHQRKELLKLQVRGAVLAGDDLDFIQALPITDLELAVGELANSVDWLEAAQDYPPTRKEIREFLPSQQPAMKHHHQPIQAECEP